MLVEIDSDGKLRPQSMAGEQCAKLFVEQGARSTNTQIPAGESVNVKYALPGDLKEVFMKNGETISIGDKLEAAGDGILQKFTTGTVIAIADEAIGQAEESKRYNATII